MVLPAEIQDAMEASSSPGAGFAGPEPFVGEALGIGAQSGFMGNTSIGPGIVRENVLRDIAERVQKRTGQRLTLPSQRVPTIPDEVAEFRQRVERGEVLQRTFEEEFLSAAAAELPDLDIRTTEDLESAVATRIRVAEAEAALARQQGRPIATLLGELGGISADPILLAGVAGGAHRATSILNSFVRNARLSAALEIPIQTVVQTKRSELGLSSGAGEALMNVAAATIGGGLFGAVFTGLGRAARRIIDEAELRKVPIPDEVRAAADLAKRAEEVLAKQPSIRTAVGQQDYLRQFDDSARAILENADPEFAFNRPATDQAIRRAEMPDEEVSVEDPDIGAVAAGLRETGRASKGKVVRASKEQREALEEHEIIEALDGIETEVLEEIKRLKRGPRGEAREGLRRIDREFEQGRINAEQRQVRKNVLRNTFIKEGTLTRAEFQEIAAGEKAPVERFVDLLERRGIDPARVSPEDLRALRLQSGERLQQVAGDLRARGQGRPGTREEQEAAALRAEVEQDFALKVEEEDFDVVVNLGDESNPQFRRMKASELQRETQARERAVRLAEQCGVKAARSSS